MNDYIKVKEEDPNKIYSIIQKIHSNSNITLYKIKNRISGKIFAGKIIKNFTNTHL